MNHDTHETQTPDLAPKATTLKYVQYSRGLTLYERFYLGPIAKGLWYTFRHLWKNTIPRNLTVTIQYPEQRRAVSGRWRGRHWLTTRQGGHITCVACKMCEMACPSNCITIVAGEEKPPYITNRQRIDKYPVSFEIDLARCIYCGLCVEACPEDAIRMDSGIVSAVGYTREEVIVQKLQLNQPGAPQHDVVYMEQSYPPEERLPSLTERYRGQKTADAAGE